MFIRVNKLTEDVIEIELGDDNVRTSVLLSLDEVSELRDMLGFIPTLPVAGVVDRWYND